MGQLFFHFSGALGGGGHPGGEYHVTGYLKYWKTAIALCEGKQISFFLYIKHSTGKKWCNSQYSTICFGEGTYESNTFCFVSDWTFSENCIGSLIHSKIQHLEDFFYLIHFHTPSCPPRPLPLPRDSFFFRLNEYNKIICSLFSDADPFSYHSGDKMLRCFFTVQY